MKKLIIFTLMISVFIACTTEKKDVHKAYWVEEVKDNKSDIKVISFNTSDKKHTKGTLIVLSDHKSEKSFKIKEISINENEVTFDITQPKIFFKGKISDDGFGLEGTFVIADTSKQSFFANKTMDEHYYKFKADYLKKED